MKDNCEKNNFENCLNYCTEKGKGTLETCVKACSTAAKKICSKRTKLSVGNTHMETENNSIAWMLFFIFVIIIFIWVLKITRNL